MSAIFDVLWQGMKALEPTSELGGILANKPGYHNARNRLPASDYSVRQYAVDREGPSDEGSAIDWTFPEAQSGNYSRIKKYSLRLQNAGLRQDPRTKYIREYYGNVDGDREVDGYDFRAHTFAGSDPSHLWHIHISIHRKYINDPTAMRAILGILRGEEEVVTEKDKQDIANLVVEKLTELTEFGDTQGGERTKISQAVMNGTYPATPNGPRTRVWSNLQKLQTTLDALSAKVDALRAKK